MDFTNIAEMFNPDKIPLRGNEHRITRVAFDLFRVDGDEVNDLWQVQADDDGEFLVRTYSLPNEEEVTKNSDWSVLIDKKCANLTILFKGVPITRTASKDYGVENKSDGKMLQGIIFRKLSADGQFASKVLDSLSENKLHVLKQSGLLDDIREWIEKKQEKENYDGIEQDNSDPKLRPNVPFGNLAAEDDEWKLAFLDLHLKKAHCGECEDNASDFDEIGISEQKADEQYEEMFDELLNSFKSKYDVGSLGDLSEDAKNELFDEMDSRWTAKSEVDDSCLASLGIPRVIDKRSTNGGKNG